MEIIGKPVVVEKKEYYVDLKIRVTDEMMNDQTPTTKGQAVKEILEKAEKKEDSDPFDGVIS